MSEQSDQKQKLPAFSSYNSLENYHREDYLRKVLQELQIRQATKPQTMPTSWIATEKVHGANFCIITDGTSVHVAKRSGVITSLEEEVKFYRADLIKEKYRPKMMEVFRHLTEMKDELQFLEINSIHVFGELFGGFYPEQRLVDIAATKTFIEQAKQSPGLVWNKTQVQKGVAYSPYIEFYGFDIRITGKKLLPDRHKNIASINETETETETETSTATVEDEKLPMKPQHAVSYLPYANFVSIMESCGFPLYAKPIFEGTLQECLDFNIRFDSTIPKLLGLPEIRPGTNICEGIVIKANNNVAAGGSRVAIKKKNPDFDEVKKVVDKKPETTSTPVNIQKFRFDEKLLIVWQAIECYITENRVDTLKSKIGDYMMTFNNLGKVTGMYTKDILEDFEKFQPDLWSPLEKEDRKKITKHLEETCKLFLKQWMFDQLEQYSTQE